jgi:membrane protein YqaA with SNARE-associated domain
MDPNKSFERVPREENAASLVERVRKVLKRFQSFADRPWYFPFLGFLAALDFYIFIVPTDALLVSSVLLRPKKWVSAFFWVGLGSALGAVALAGALQAGVFSVPDSETWVWLKGFFSDYGGVALALIALSPLVQFPVVVLAALSGMPLEKIFLICLVGRWIKSAVFAYVASRAPELLFKIPFLKKELEILGLSGVAKLSKST